MRVKIELTVAVDPHEWHETYGCGNDAASIRDDVRLWATSAILNHPDGLVSRYERGGKPCSYPRT